MRGLSRSSHRGLRRDGDRARVRSRLRRHTAVVALAAAAALVVVALAGWTALRPAASERDPAPRAHPDRHGTEPGAETRPDPTPAVRDSVRDTVAALEGGADDDMPKPFRFEELLARVRLRLSGGRQTETTVLTCGDLSLDLRTRRAQAGSRTVDLSAREFALAETFLRHPGQVLAREQLLSHVWGYDFDPGSNVVDVYVRYLRRKLGAARIETVRGMGYRLVAD
jgi:Transcriptional regulatory protein, C terminal